MNRAISLGVISPTTRESKPCSVLQFIPQLAAPKRSHATVPTRQPTSEAILSYFDSALGGVPRRRRWRYLDAVQPWPAVTRIPDEDAEVGHCVHRVARHPSRPDTLFMQKHWDVMRSDDGGGSWVEVSGNLPTDFGFPIAVHAHEPETVYVVPITSGSEHYVPEGRLRAYHSRTGGHEWQPLTEGLPQRDCYVNVLREAMAVDSLDPCGIYFGTTGGQVYASADGGDHWSAVVRDLPRVLSVEVQVLS